ncbi:hypothetical protein CHS0354_011398 [Potamilus streckersoni]|uniref:Palmitoyltransferase n=1 Tax=Potamilus streckersoni TaxID=2493646 RepID=A0AAE0TG08_9BIVA|nr:hypothetical protein CHS0354_011398 [Potamilus streckersoni]
MVFLTILKSRLGFKAGEDVRLKVKVLNLLACPVYLYTISSVWFYMVTEVLPYHYTDAIRYHMTFITVVCLEMMLNWFCIRRVESSFTSNSINKIGLKYDSSLYKGVRPDSPYTSESNQDKNVFPSEESYSLENMSLKDFCRSGEDGSSNVSLDPVFQNQYLFKTSTTTPPKRSYWSWKHCEKCGVMKPPRCNHCFLCGACVLKRDHHCYFVGKCVGLRNQRHFIVFCAWASVGTIYASVHFINYFYKFHWPELRIWDLYAPMTMIRCLLGFTSFFHTQVILTLTFLILFVIVSTGFFLSQAELIFLGITTFERKPIDGGKVKIVDTRSLKERITSVFGAYWTLNFLLPLHFLFPPLEDGVNWVHIKIVPTERKMHV